MFRGVILRSAGLQAAPGGFQRGADKDTGSKFFLAMGERLLSVGFGPWAGGIGKIV
jgi:hypothetical protein